MIHFNVRSKSNNGRTKFTMLWTNSLNIFYLLFPALREREREKREKTQTDRLTYAAWSSGGGQSQGKTEM